MSAHSPHAQAAPSLSHGGPPLSVVIVDARRVPNHTPPTPMDVDRREGVPPYPRESKASIGPSRCQPSMLLHQPQPPPEPHHAREPYYG
jgi:hypothetical protein